jgi:hypothetical protein
MKMLYKVLTAGMMMTTMLRADISLSSHQVEQFLKPVTFSQYGIADFFLTTFNDRIYASQFLPSCFLHLDDFLRYASTTDSPTVFALTSLELFHQRLKEARWVNPFALIEFLESSMPLIASLCRIEERKNNIPPIKQILYDALLHRFNDLKETPDIFLTTVAEEIDRLTMPDEEREKKTELKLLYIRLIESALDKLIWDPRDEECVWQSVILLTNQLEQLLANNILAEDRNLNPLLWSLTYRLCYFLETHGARLPINCYQTMKNDCMLQLNILTRPEEEDLVTNRKERLLRAILDGEIKARAYARGIITY